ncbi:MAG: GGDEF domain-containing protein [Alteromonadales bacterium]|nr:GGDEF domain-containing protein [Alteromonadales bacterium]
MRKFQCLLVIFLLSISNSIFALANSLDPWLAIENGNYSPHEIIGLSLPLLKTHKTENYLPGVLRGYIQLSTAYISLEKNKKAKGYLLLATKLNKQLNSSSEQVRINNLQSSFHALNGELKLAVELMTSNLALSKTLNDVVVQGYTLMHYAYIMKLESQFEEAIEALYSAQIIFEKLEDKKSIMTIQSYLAMIYGKLNNYPKSIEYYEHAAHFAKQLNDDFSLSIFYYNLGTSYLSIKDWQKTIHYFSKARELSILLDDQVGVALATAELANVMVNNNQFKDAISLLLEVDNMLKDNGSVFRRLKIKLNIALSYAKTAQEVLARQYLQEVLTLQESSGEDSRFPYKLFGTVYVALEDYKNASTVFLKHIDRLHNEFEAKKNISIQRLEVIYDVRFEKSRNELLQKENLLKEAELIQQNQYRLILVLVLVLALLILWGTFRHIKIQRKSNRMLKELAFKDELTKIANRRGILDFAKNSVEQIKGDDSQLILAIIDLDYFKRVNDTYGHDVGDNVLKYFAKIASESLRSYEKVGRYGGEEWLVVLPKAQREEIPVLFEKMSKAYKECIPKDFPKELTLSFSLGAVVVDTEHNGTVKELLQKADTALYKAKSAGRDGYSIFN